MLCEISEQDKCHYIISSQIRKSHILMLCAISKQDKCHYIISSQITKGHIHMLGAISEQDKCHHSILYLDYWVEKMLFVLQWFGDHRLFNFYVRNV